MPALHNGGSLVHLDGGRLTQGTPLGTGTDIGFLMVLAYHWNMRLSFHADVDTEIIW